MSSRGVAILMAYQGLGSVAKLAQTLGLYGYGSVICLTDDGKTLPPEAQALVQVKEVDVFNPQAVAEAVRDIMALDRKGDYPFLCVADRLAFSFLEARNRIPSSTVTQWSPRLAGEIGGHGIPESGIRRARVKPWARNVWNRERVDMSRWAVHSDAREVCGNLNTRGPSIESDREVEFYVKPLCGMASEMVRRVKGVEGILAHASEIEAYFADRRIRGGDGSITTIDDDFGHTYNLYKDVLIEEVLTGPEFTVDGFVVNGEVACVVQHKESRNESSFVGDGLITSPPEYATYRIGQVQDSSLLVSTATVPPLGDFIVLVRRGLAVLGIDNWAFHAEVIATPDGLRFVELNPRPAGGLLWLTAGMQLGIDPFEALVRLHLRIPTAVPRPHWVTGQFPIYAHRPGEIRAVHGIAEARDMPFVKAITNIAAVGTRIVGVNRENYLAFVAIQAPSHEAVREAEWQVRRLIRFDIQ